MRDFLCVNEQFTSISGEVGNIRQGTLCSVVRLQGCNLTCWYCDAKSSQDQDINAGAIISVEEMAKYLIEADLPILITGGEPLLQGDSVRELLDMIPMNMTVQIETNGTVAIELFQRENVSFVMDFKIYNPPRMSNILSLGEEDYLKFVVSSEDEIKAAIVLIKRMTTPIWTNAISATDLSLYQPMIRAIKESSPKTIANVQLHKTISVR